MEEIMEEIINNNNKFTNIWIEGYVADRWQIANVDSGGGAQKFDVKRSRACKKNKMIFCLLS
jgi:hypothetical protein